LGLLVYLSGIPTRRNRFVRIAAQEKTLLKSDFSFPEKRFERSSRFFHALSDRREIGFGLEKPKLIAGFRFSRQIFID